MIMGCLLGQVLRAQTLGVNVIVNGDAEIDPTSIAGKWVDFSSADFGDAAGTDDIESITITLTAQNANTVGSIEAYFDDLSLVGNLINLINLPVTLVDFHALQQPDHTVALIAWEW